MLIVVHREDDDFGFRVVAENFLGGFDAAETGQADVHENEVGFGVPAKLNGLESGGGFAHDVEVVELVENGADAGPEDSVVVHQQDLIGHNNSLLRSKVAGSVTNDTGWLNGSSFSRQEVDTESRVLHVARLKRGLSTTQPLRRDELRARLSCRSVSRRITGSCRSHRLLRGLRCRGMGLVHARRSRGSFWGFSLFYGVRLLYGLTGASPDRASRIGYFEDYDVRGMGLVHARQALPVLAAIELQQFSHA
jgi:hypothetical protein